MKNASFRSTLLALAGSFALIGAATPALAQHAGGGAHVSGGGFRGGAFHGGGYRGGAAGFHGGYGYRGGYPGYGYRGGYGYYHGGYGWRGGYGWGGWGWGGVGLGLYFATLPWYYSTYWYGGVPYYYADDVYYRYDTSVGQYETVTPPDEVRTQASQAQGSAGSTDLIAYPKSGQTDEQQSKDKYECHHWAVTQTGFDPTQGSTAANSKRTDYMRAQAACLEGRGYSVK